MALISAGNTKLLDPLKDPLGGYAKAGQNSLANALGTLGNQARTSSGASGRVRGDYTDQALGRANTLASSGIEDTVGGILGGASLKDAQTEKEFQAQMALANEIGSMNSPSTLEEILAGLGGGASTGLQFKGLYDALGKSKGGPPGLAGSLPPSLSLYDPSASGYGRYVGGN